VGRHSLPPDTLWLAVCPIGYILDARLRPRTDDGVTQPVAANRQGTVMGWMTTGPRVGSNSTDCNTSGRQHVHGFRHRGGIDGTDWRRIVGRAHAKLERLGGVMKATFAPRDQVGTALQFLDTVVRQAGALGLPSDDHFTVAGTLIEAATRSLKRASVPMTTDRRGPTAGLERPDDRVGEWPHPLAGAPQSVPLGIAEPLGAIRGCCRALALVHGEKGLLAGVGMRDAHRLIPSPGAASCRNATMRQMRLGTVPAVPRLSRP
jgi:hypothetical protein